MIDTIIHNLSEFLDFMGKQSLVDLFIIYLIACGVGTNIFFLYLFFL